MDSKIKKMITDTMTKEEEKIVKQWEEVSDLVAGCFILRYFSDSLDNINKYWFNGDKGTTIVINNYAFDLERMIEALKLEATSKQLFDFYDIELLFSQKDKSVGITFEDYVKHS